MESLIVVNQKGGVGKTTISVNLAHHFAQTHKVAAIDIDNQRNLTTTLERYSNGIGTSDFFLNPGKIKIDPPQQNLTLFPATNKLLDVDNKGMNIPETAKKLRQVYTSIEKAGYDICIVDSPAAFGTRLYASLANVKWVLIPIKLEKYSIDGLTNMLKTIINSKDQHGANPAKILGIAVNEMDRRKPSHIEAFKELRTSLPKYILPIALGNRTAFSGLSDGKPIWANKQSAARAAIKESKEFAREVLERIERAK